MSNRKQDEMHTRTVETLMNAEYKKHGLKILRNEYDVQLQTSGVDMVLDSKDGPMFVDEKFAIDYRNRVLNTYSFELESSNHTNTRGWFLNDNLITTHYMLLWFQSDEEITKLNSYEACLISKNEIKNFIKNDGIDINEFIRIFKDCYEKGITPPEGYSVRKGATFKITKGEYALVKSTLKSESPLNLIIPKDKLLLHAEKVLTPNQEPQSPIIEKEYPNLNNIISKKTMDLLSTKGIVSGNLYYKSNNIINQRLIKSPQNGDEILIQIGNEKYTAAVYKNGWFNTNGNYDIHQIAGKSVKNLDSDIVKSVIKGESKYIKCMDSTYNKIEFYSDYPRHGCILQIKHPMTNDNIATLQYSRYLNRYVLYNGSQLNTLKIPKINKFETISEDEYSLKRAVADRFIKYAKKNHYNGETLKEAKEYIAQAVKTIFDNDFEMNRISSSEIMFLNMSKDEKLKLMNNFLEKDCITTLATALRNPRSNIYTKPDVFIAASYVDNQRRTQELKRMSTLWLANKAGCKIETFEKDGRILKTVNWDEQSVSKACDFIVREKNEERYLIEGYAPSWVLTALSNACTPNECSIVNKANSINVKSLDIGSSSEDIKFKIKRSYLGVDINFGAVNEDMIMADISKVKAPPIEDGQIVFISGDNKHSYMNPLLGKTYEKNAAAVFYKQKDSNYICAISNDKNIKVGQLLSPQNYMLVMSAQRTEQKQLHNQNFVIQDNFFEITRDEHF